MPTQNITSSIMPVQSIGSVSTTGGWLLTIIIFVTVLVTVFILSKNIRQFFYGGIATVVLLLNYKLSRWVGLSSTQNNFAPLKLIGVIIGFVVVSILLGQLIQKIPGVKKWEKKIIGG